MGQNQKLADALRGERQRIEALAEEVEKLSQPPASFGVYLGTNDDGSIDVFTGGRKMRVTPAPDLDLTRFRPGSQVILNDSLNAVEVLDPDRAGRGREGEGPTGHRPRRGRRPRRRGVRGHARRQPGGRGRARGGPAALRPALGRRARAAAEGRGRAAGPGGDPGRQLRGHRRPGGPDRSDPRRRRAAVPVLGAVPRARAGAAEGRAALRTSRLRQDADREGRREVARREGRRAHRPRRRAQLLPEREGPGAAQQVRRRDRAPDPRDLPARQGAQRGRPAGHRVLR